MVVHLLHERRVLNPVGLQELNIRNLENRKLTLFLFLKWIKSSRHSNHLNTGYQKSGNIEFYLLVFQMHWLDNLNTELNGLILRRLALRVESFIIYYFIVLQSTLKKYGMNYRGLVKNYQMQVLHCVK